MFEDIYLTPEQEALFKKMAQALLSQPPEKRQRIELWSSEGDNQLATWLVFPEKSETWDNFNIDDLRELRDQGLISWGIRSPDLTMLGITNKGEKYYRYITTPQPLDTNAQLQRVLTVLDQYSRQQPNHYIDDKFVAAKLQMDIQDIRDYLDVLEQRGLTKSANSHSGYAAIPTATGRLALKDPAFYQNNNTSTVNFSGPINNAIFNVNSTLTEVTQTLNASSNVAPDLKATLTELVQQLQAELASVPQEHAEETEAVAELAKEVIDSATKDKSNKTRVRISAEGLQKAAETIAKIAPPVLLTVTKIIETIQPLLPK